MRTGRDGDKERRADMSEQSEDNVDWEHVN